MIVVADTTPINYLILIGHADILGDLFQRVLIPDAVRFELNDRAAPPAVHAFMNQPPPWLEVRGVSSILVGIEASLDLGEKEAISLAMEVNSAAIAIDEIRGRREAILRGLQVVGTLGILERAHDAGLLDLRSALRKLQSTSFFISPSLIANSIRSRY
jgi:predicted nucleic acid-binding protein